MARVKGGNPIKGNGRSSVFWGKKKGLVLSFFIFIIPHVTGGGEATFFVDIESHICMIDSIIQQIS